MHLIGIIQIPCFDLTLVLILYRKIVVHLIGIIQIPFFNLTLVLMLYRNCNAFDRNNSNSLFSLILVSVLMFKFFVYSKP